MAFDFGADALAGVGSLGEQGLGAFNLPQTSMFSDISPENAAFGLSATPNVFDTGTSAVPFTGNVGADVSPGAYNVLSSSGFTTPALGGTSAGADTPTEETGNPFDDARKPQAAAGQTTSLSAQSQQPQQGGMSQLGKSLLMAAPAMGVAGFQAFRGPQYPSALGDLKGLAGQQAGEASLLSSQYNAGQIQPGAAAMVASNYRQQLAKINQYFAKAGRFNSTDRIKAVQLAQSQMVQQYSQFLDAELTSSLKASGQAGQFFAQAAQIQMQADTAFNNALSNAMQGIGKVLAMGLSGNQQKAA
jgi:hypothetical protein